MNFARIAIGGALVVALTGPGFAARGEPPVEPVTGRELFARNCVGCHGEQGRGDAPIAAIFRDPPADLTRLAVRRGGFDAEAIATELAEGRHAAHGERIMPVWGRWLGPQELARLVDYLGNIQAVEPTGSGLYTRYCASCHGLDGRGDSLVSTVLRERPPDLTTLARRNQGWFAEIHVQEIVDGRFAAHGTREMPIWGHLLTKDELILLSEHLASMQTP